ncbi:MAG: nitroreductase family protein [Candidatus Aminicenantes bacterium]|nr:nitroreductase family protein [Candidatus Aminicenantes bacterium]
MTVLEAIQKRRSVRKYRPDSVPEEVLRRVLEAARLAPSGKNLQPWRFILVRSAETKERLARASADQTFIAEAPLVVVACADPESSYARMGRYMKSWTVDVACALEHLMLQAAAEGLGTCWIGAFEEGAVKALLDVPDGIRVLALTPLGYPADDPDFGGRKRLEEIVFYERYGSFKTSNSSRWK